MSKSSRSILVTMGVVSRQVLAGLLVAILSMGVAFGQGTPITPSYTLNTSLTPWQVGCTRSGSPSSNVSAPTLLRNAEYMSCVLPYGATAIRIALPAFTTQTSGSYKGEKPLPDGVFTVASIKAITAGGANYAVGDLIVQSIYGAGTKPAVIQVDEVAAGLVTKAHVTVGGTYTTQLADSTAQMAVWQVGQGFGAYVEGQVNGADLSTFYSGMFTGGMNYASGTTTVNVVPSSCTGGTATPNYDVASGSIQSVSKGGTFTGCNSTTGNPVLAINSCATTCGSGATFSYTWAGYAYAARISIDPVFQTQTCSLAVLGTCVHRTATASTNGPPVNIGTDNLGLPADIFVNGNGQAVITDPISIALPPGSKIGIRYYLIGNVPHGRLTALAGELSLNGGNIFDYTQSQTFASTAAVNNGAMQPIAVLVRPITPGPALIGFGDSRLYGTSSLASGSSVDVYDTVNGCSGWLERAVCTNMPWINMSKAGDELYGWMRSRTLRYAAMKVIAMNGVFPQLCYMGWPVNDFIQSHTFAEAQAEEAQMVSDIRGFGCRFVFTDTTDPYNQSPTGGGTAFAWAEITAGGTGYAASSTFDVTIPGGTFTTAAVVNVTTNGSGVVTTVNTITTPGQYSANPTSTNSCAANKCLGMIPTGGAGSGLIVTGYMTAFTATATSTPNATATPQILLRNAQLRTAGFGTYAGIYDGVLDWNGITENGAGTGTWVPLCTVDGLHAAPMCIFQKAAFAAPRIAAWAAQAYAASAAAGLQ